MALPRHLQARLVSLACVGALSVSAVLGLWLVLPGRGLAQLAPNTGRAFGDGLTQVSIDGQTVDACTFRIRVESDRQPPGTFLCEMSDAAIALGVPFNSVQGLVESVIGLFEHSAGLSGTAEVGLPGGGTLHSVPFQLRVVEGGPGQGALRIQLTGVFDGEPGDTKPGNDSYDQSWQSVTEGSIRVSAEPSPTPSPSESPSPSPTPSPSPSPSPSPTPTPSQSPSPQPSPPGGGSFTPPPSPSVTLPPLPVPPAPHSANTSASLMALLAQVSPNGIPEMSDILQVVGPFPVAGLAWWQDDWHAYRCCPYPHLHQGLDMFAQTGTPVVAAADGFVSQRVNGAISGLGVEITDAAGTQYFYAHLSGFAPGLVAGQQVHVGQVLGYVGNTGDAITTSPHLHFEIQPHGIPVPPKPFVDSWLVIAEQKAQALAESRVGHAILNPDTLAHWLAKAQSLHSLYDFGEGSDAADQQAALAGTRTDPRSFSGLIVGIASLMLLMGLVAPGCLLGLREARNGPAWRRSTRR